MLHRKWRHAPVMGALVTGISTALLLAGGCFPRGGGAGGGGLPPPNQPPPWGGPGVITTGNTICSPPPGHTPPQPKLASGMGCNFGVDCASGLCNAGKCYEPVEGQECAAKLGAGYHGVFTSPCGDPSSTSLVCLGPETASPKPLCAEAKSCCDVDSPCSDHAQCCSGSCYVTAGSTSGACMETSTHFLNNCPFGHRLAVHSKTDPTSYCAPAPDACASSSCKIVQVAPGIASQCFRRASGDVYCWGKNDKQQLGDGTTTDRAYPTQAVPGLTDAVDLSAAKDEVCAVRATGQVVCWGHGKGQHLLALNGVKRISVGEAHSCAVTLAGTVLCWGANKHGQLGNSSISDSASPVEVKDLTGPVAEVSVGRIHTCARLESGGVMCWGAEGRLGTGSGASATAAVSVVGINDAISVSAGEASCAARKNGTVWCWGTVPAAVDEIAGARAVSAAYLTVDPVAGEPQEGAATAEPKGIGRACAAYAEGRVKCWIFSSTMEVLKATDQLETYDGPGGPPMKRLLTGAAAVVEDNWRACVLKDSGEVLCGSPQVNGGPFDTAFGTNLLP
ncbi:MAG: hypothetical protein R3B70_49070 [Polyangiaceae bacterium]